MSALRIYLAGKIAKGGWRDELVGPRAGALSPSDWREAWTDLPQAILGVHTYVGPFFVGCDHGCAHGAGTHGAGLGPYAGTKGQYATGFAEAAEEGEHYEDAAWGCAGETTPENLDVLIMRRCLGAIRRADLVFAWVDAMDAFGTFAELGYARGIGVPVGLAAPAPFPPDLWFPRVMSTAYAEASTPREGLLKLLPRLWPAIRRRRETVR